MSFPNQSVHWKNKGPQKVQACRPVSVINFFLNESSGRIQWQCFVCFFKVIHSRWLKILLQLAKLALTGLTECKIVYELLLTKQIWFHYNQQHSPLQFSCQLLQILLPIILIKEMKILNSMPNCTVLFFFFLVFFSLNAHKPKRNKKNWNTWVVLMSATWSNEKFLASGFECNTTVLPDVTSKQGVLSTSVSRCLLGGLTRTYTLMLSPSPLEKIKYKKQNKLSN